MNKQRYCVRIRQFCTAVTSDKCHPANIRMTHDAHIKFAVLHVLYITKIMNNIMHYVHTNIFIWPVHPMLLLLCAATIGHVLKRHSKQQFYQLFDKKYSHTHSTSCRHNHLLTAAASQQLQQTITTNNTGFCRISLNDFRHIPPDCSLCRGLHLDRGVLQANRLL
jgi:hypothetical protein